MDEQHNESRLREELHHAVDHVQVPSDMWSRIRGRHRREPRQRMLAVATSMALLAIVVAAAFPLVRDAAERAAGPVGGTSPEVVTDGPMPTLEGESELAPTPEAQDGPLGQATAPERTVASGEFEGERWELFARKYAEGICYELRLGQPNTRATRGSCDPYEGMPMAGAVSVVVDGGPSIPTSVFGVVREEAAVVRVEFPDGTVHDVSPVARDMDFPVAFYALAVPPAGAPSVDVTAYDAQGNPLGPPEEPLGPESPGKEPPEPEPPESGNSPLGLEPATGPVVTLDSGEIEGMPWEFVAHRWAEGICFGFRNERGMAGGGVAVCDPGSPGIGVRGDGGEGQPAFAWGAFPRDTEVIRIQLNDGQAFEVPPLGQEEFGVSFFVRVLPTGTSMEGVWAVEVAQAEGIGDPVPTTTTPNG